MEKQDEFAVLKTACIMGRLLLQSGGEIFRVEETVSRFCLSYGLESVQCFVTPTAIITSIETDKALQTYMLRVYMHQWNLDRIEMINDLSRHISKCPMPIDQVLEMLKKIEKEKPYGLLVTTIASAIGIGAFAIVFGGTIYDFLSGIIIGVPLRFAMHQLGKHKFQPIFANFVGGVLAAMAAWFLVTSGLGTDWQLLTVSALTLLFPGITFTNALRNAAVGDFVSSVAHAVESLTITAALAGGAAMALGLLEKIGGAVV